MTQVQYQAIDKTIDHAINSPNDIGRAADSVGHTNVSNVSCAGRSTDQDIVFAKIQFGPSALSLNDKIELNCGLQTLGESTAEIWTNNNQMVFGQADDLSWCHDEHTFFAALLVDEDSAAEDTSALSKDSNKANKQYETIIESAYLRLLSLLAEHQFKNIARMWNYIPRINEGDGDQERYKQFSSGRFKAFQTMQYSAGEFPAACALGHFGDKTVIYLLASKNATRNFENPKQTEAYQYPREYGIFSPSFARATLLENGSLSTLFISGTASITGSQSQHIDSLEQQIKLSCNNITTLVKHIERQLDDGICIKPTSFKVYLRDKDHYQSAKQLLKNYWPDDITTVFTHADICRQELLVEIEAICQIAQYPK